MAKTKKQDGYAWKGFTEGDVLAVRIRNDLSWQISDTQNDKNIIRAKWRSAYSLSEGEPEWKTVKKAEELTAQEIGGEEMDEDRKPKDAQVTVQMPSGKTVQIAVSPQHLVLTLKRLINGACTDAQLSGYADTDKPALMFGTPPLQMKDHKRLCEPEYAAALAQGSPVLLVPKDIVQIVEPPAISLDNASGATVADLERAIHAAVERKDWAAVNQHTSDLQALEME